MGVNTGVLEPFKVTGVAGLDDRCGGTGGGASSSSIGSAASRSVDMDFLCSLEGAEADTRRSSSISSSISLTGVVGWLDFLSLGMLGSSIDGTEETRL